MVPGLKAKADIESSGGDATSKSFIGFTVAVVVPPVNEVEPKFPWENIFEKEPNVEL